MLAKANKKHEFLGKNNDSGSTVGELLVADKGYLCCKSYFDTVLATTIHISCGSETIDSFTSNWELTLNTKTFDF